MSSNATVFQINDNCAIKDVGGRRFSKKERPRCSHCQKIGHMEDQYFEIMGYHSDWQKNANKKERRFVPKVAQAGPETIPVPGLTHEQFNCLVQYLSADQEATKQMTSSVVKPVSTPVANMAGKKQYDKLWVIDSGATEHITCEDNLQEEGVYLGSSVRIPNGDNIPVKGIGKIKLANGLLLNDVLKIPSFKCNLISVAKLTRDYNCTLIFFPDFCVI